MSFIEIGLFHPHIEGQYVNLLYIYWYQSVVVGFPHGTNKPEVKALEAKLAIEDGANEIDMVMNVGKFLSGDYDWVQRDIEAVVAEAKPHDVSGQSHPRNRASSTPRTVAKACKIAEAAGADYVKTSTGFGEDGPATPEVIDIMIKTVGQTMRSRPPAACEPGKRPRLPRPGLQATRRGLDRQAAPGRMPGEGNELE